MVDRQIQFARYRREVRATAGLAAPLALTQLVQMAMGFVDVVMIGRLGPEAMAAGVMATSFFFTLMLSCMGIIMAVNPLVAQAVGKRDVPAVGRAVRQGLWLGVLLGIPLMVVYSQTEPLLRAAGQEAETSRLAASYMKAILWGTVPSLWYTALRGFAEGVARPRPILLVTIAASIVNVFGNWVLMYGNLGMPALGLAGTGWSSAIVMWALFGGMLLVTQSSRVFRSYSVFDTVRTPDRRALRALFQLGWPIGVTFGLESGLFLAATLLMGWVGTAALAAHQVALNASGVTFMIPLGIAMATTVRVGHAAGAGDAAGARRAGWSGMAIGCTVMFIPALLFWLRPEWVVWVYMGSAGLTPEGAEVARQAAVLLGVAAVFQLFDGLQVTAGGALRGLKETRAPMVVGIIAYWGLGLSAAYLLTFEFGWGAPGIWWGLTLGLATAAIGLPYWFRRRIGVLAGEWGRPPAPEG
jgi:multidrug resistance protein, MATE family